MRDVKRFNIRQMGGANMIVPASCAFLRRVDFFIILHSQMWKSGHRGTKGCGSRSLVPGPREGVSLHWEGSSASSWPGTSSPSETDRVPHLSGTVHQTGEISFCSAA